MVWAVDEAHVANFLTPRECPRITYAHGPRTTSADAERFLGGASRVVAFEAAWLERLRACVLHLYELPPASFRLEDAGAGYWISEVAVEPVGVRTERDLLAALATAGVEVRVLQDFWPLRDAVANSSLEFSIMKTDRAAPRRS